MAQPLVHANPWLKDSHYADAAARYGQGYLRAVRHIGRISHSRHDDAQLHPFLICTEKRIGVVPPRTAIGIGTIITRQLLEVPNATPGGNFLALKGNDLDYWIDAEMGEVPGLHREVANALLVRSLSLAAKERGALNNFATLQQHRSHQPEGFAHIMSLVGEPCAPMTPDDHFGILKDGTLLQVYATGGYGIADAMQRTGVV